MAASLSDDVAGNTPGRRVPCARRGIRPSRLLLGVVLLILPACGSDAAAPEEVADPITTVTVTTTTEEVEIEEIAEVSATVLTARAEDVTTTSTITWSSSDPDVAGVSGAGASVDVIGVGGGSAIITASAGGRSGSVTITVLWPPPVITTAVLADGEVGVAYGETLEAADGDGTFAWTVSAGALPDGLALNAATGEITGTPTTEGTFAVTFAVESGGRSAEAAFSMTIDPAATGNALRTAVINVDFMNTVIPGMDTVYVGDDGIYSTPGATYWNGSDSFTDLDDLPDEAGAASAVDLHTNLNGGTFIGAASNELQDNGVSTAGITEDGFEWRDLVPDSVYDLAFYVYAEAVLERSTTLDVVHAGGTTPLGPNQEPTWALPGEEGMDYLLLEGVQPFEMEPGVWGIRINNINDGGVVMGLQLRGPVASP